MEGNGNIDELKKSDEAAAQIGGTTICALGDAAAMPVQSFLQHFRDEFVAYIEKNQEKVA